MVQLKKKAVLLIGAAMLFLGMGMTLQYALDDYGLAKNNAVIAIWAQQIQTGKDPAGTGGNDGGCKDCNLAGGKGATSCSCESGSISALGVEASGRGCSVSTGSGYYSCCRVTSDGLCKCPSCKNNH